MMMMHEADKCKQLWSWKFVLQRLWRLHACFFPIMTVSSLSTRGEVVWRRQRDAADIGKWADTEAGSTGV